MVETKVERASHGHPVGQDTLYKAMGGLTGFSSMLEGYERLDSSGIGVPPVGFLDQPVNASDHPFLRANVHSIAANKYAAGSIEEALKAEEAERKSQTLRAGETEMEFYERRYKEREKAGQKANRNRPIEMDMNLALIQTQQQPTTSQNHNQKKGGGYVIKSQTPKAATTRSSSQHQSGSSTPNIDPADLMGLSISGTSSTHNKKRANKFNSKS